MTVTKSIAHSSVCFSRWSETGRVSHAEICVGSLGEICVGRRYIDDILLVEVDSHGPICGVTASTS